MARPALSAGESGRLCTVAVDQEYAPYEFVDETGRVTGFVPELLAELGRRCNIRFRFLAMSWPDALAALRQGRVTLVNMIRLPERQAEFVFSTPHSTIEQGIFRYRGAKEIIDLESLAGHRVALQQGDIAQLMLAPRDDFRPVIVHSKEQGFLMLNAGRVDAFIAATQPGLFLRRKYDLQQVELVAVGLFTQPFCLAALPGNEALLTRINRQLAAVRQQPVYRALSAKWLAQGVLADSGRLQVHKGVVFGALFTLLTTAGLFYGWNVSLRRKVARATEELRRGREDYRRLVDVLEYGISWIGADYRIRLVNAAQAGRLGKPAAVLVGTRCYQSFAGRSAPCVDCPGSRVLAGCGSATVEREVAAPAGDHSRVVRLRAYPMTRAGDRGFLEICEDITQQRQAERTIRRSLTEKEILLREVHHRVKNNMQVIHSLLRSHARKLSDPESRKLFTHCEGQVRAMALVHQHLQQGRDVTGIRLQPYLRDLLASLRNSRPQGTGHVDLDLEVEADVRLPVEYAIPCGLVVNELVCNALQHAFPHGRSGTIAVTCTVTPKEQADGYRIVITDNGVGIGRGGHKGSSLGLGLVRNLVACQLKGEFAIAEDCGTRATIDFIVAQSASEASSMVPGDRGLPGSVSVGEGRR